MTGRALPSMTPTENSRPLISPHVLDLCQMADMVFLGLHGANGEDGRIQAAFR